MVLDVGRGELDLIWMVHEEGEPREVADSPQEPGWHDSDVTRIYNSGPPIIHTLARSLAHRDNVKCTVFMRV